MATHPLRHIGLSAIDLVATLSLSAGDVLSVQSRGPRAVHYAEAAAQPASAYDGCEQLVGRWGYFTVGSSPIWYWSPYPDGGSIVVNVA